MNKPSCLAIIPARSGSRRLLAKNIRQFCGRPLIAWTIETALSCPVIDRIIVSTDDEGIARIAREHGAEVPFLRPKDLARDDTPDLPVYNHALSWLEEHENFRPEIMVWLRPTSPLRETNDIESAVSLLLSDDVQCVRSVTLAKDHPYWMKQMRGNKLLPLLEGYDETTYYQRQLLPPVYCLNGAIDTVRCEKVEKTHILFGGETIGYVMPFERGIDIDDEFDFIVAQTIMKRKLSCQTQ